MNSIIILLAFVLCVWLIAVYGSLKRTRSNIRDYKKEFRRVLIDIGKVRRNESPLPCEVIDIGERHKVDTEGLSTSMLHVRADMRPGDMLKAEHPFVDDLVVYVNGIAMHKNHDFIIRDDLLIWNGDFDVDKTDSLLIQEAAPGLIK
jgi:hypothetical protein